MFPVIETIIKNGQFTGCNITIKTTPNNTLSAVLTFLLPANACQANDTANKSDSTGLDNMYALRSALVSPLVVKDTGSGLNDAIVQALSNVEESFIQGAKVLSAIDVSALIDQTSSKVTSQATTKLVKKTPVKPIEKKETDTQPKKVVDAPVEVKQPWEDELQSL